MPEPLSPGALASETISDIEDRAIRLTSEAISEALDELSHIERIFLPGWPYLPLMDLVLRYSANMRSIPARTLAAMTGRWLAANFSQHSASRVMTEREVVSFVTNFLLDGAYYFAGLPGRSALGFAHHASLIQRVRGTFLSKFTAKEGGIVLRAIKWLGSPIRIVLWLWDVMANTLTFFMVWLVVMLIVAWVERVEAGKLRQQMLPQTSPRRVVDLPPKRIRLNRRRRLPFAFARE